MAVNDVIAHYQCKLCGSEMNEIPGIDGWGEHVYSYFKCSNVDCDNKAEIADNDFDEKIISTFTNIADKEKLGQEIELYPKNTTFSNSLENSGYLMPFWNVKLGKLYYAGGLPRISPKENNINSYEFVDDEDMAFIFLLEEFTKDIVEMTGGEVIRKELKMKELAKLQEQRDKYHYSQKEWEDEQKKELFNGILGESN